MRRTRTDFEVLEQMGNRLRKCRQKQKLTQAQVAERLGIPTNNYGRVENGKQGCKWKDSDSLPKF